MRPRDIRRAQVRAERAIRTADTIRRRAIQAAYEAGEALWCECGRPKERDAEACPRCTSMDALDLSSRARWLLWELRELGGEATAQAILGHTTHEPAPGAEANATRRFYRACADLRAVGMVQAFSDADEDPGPAPERIYRLKPRRGIEERA